MKKLFILLSASVSFSLFGSMDDPGYYPMAGSPLQGEQREPSNIIITNRLLAKIGSATISLIDVVKKMNSFIHQHIPDLFDSKIALYQFYLNNWGPTLDELINNELILLEADEKEVKVSDGDVREEMEERFGPNIMTKLDKLSLSYEEAKKMVHDDLQIRQLLWFKVHARAIQAVTPSVIKVSFKEYLALNPPVEEWDYQVLSIRGGNQSFCEQIATDASTFLTEEASDLKTIASKLQSGDPSKAKNVSISVSEDYHVDSKSISTQHKEVLSHLKEKTYSAPTMQKSRVDNSTVYRIFYLKSYTKNEPPTFQIMADKLKDELIGKAVDKEKTIYIKHLEKKYNYPREIVKESLPENYTPFALN